MNNKYGFRLCYKENKYSKLKTQTITLSLELILLELKWYYKHKFINRKKEYIPNPIWYIFEVKTLREYNKLWRGCPFKDDLS